MPGGGAAEEGTNTAAALASRVGQLERGLEALLERVDQLERARGPAPCRDAVRSLQAERKVHGDDNWGAPVRAITPAGTSAVPDAEAPEEPDSFDCATSWVPAIDLR